MSCINCSIQVSVSSLTPNAYTLTLSGESGSEDSINVSDMVNGQENPISVDSIEVYDASGNLVTGGVTFAIVDGVLTATKGDIPVGTYELRAKVCQEDDEDAVTDERPFLVEPNFPQAQQSNAYPVSINSDGTAEWSVAESFTLSAEPSIDSAINVTTLEELRAAMINRPPLIRVFGPIMDGMFMTFDNNHHDSEADGVTVIEPTSPSARLPYIRFNSSDGFFIRDFKNQPANWGIACYGACDSIIVDNVGYREKAATGAMQLHPPKKEDGMMSNCWLQNTFSCYDEHNYDSVMFIIGLEEARYEPYTEAHAYKCGTINVSSLNWGDTVQTLAHHTGSAWVTPITYDVVAWVNCEDCRFINTLGVSTFSSGRTGGNNSPENTSDHKSKSMNSGLPLQNVGTFGIGFGPSTSDQGIGGAIGHIADGSAIVSNGLTVGCASGFASSSYTDGQDLTVTDCHVCGDLDYSPWRDITDDADYTNDGTPLAFTNYIAIAGSPAADMSRNTYSDRSTGGTGGASLVASVDTYTFTLPSEFAQFDSRLSASFDINLPTGAKEIEWQTV